MRVIDHAATAHLDSPKERALRNDYDDADFEVRQLKDKLKHVRMIPLSEEAEAMFYWRNRARYAEQVISEAGLGHKLSLAPPPSSSKGNET